MSNPTADEEPHEKLQPPHPLALRLALITGGIAVGFFLFIGVLVGGVLTLFAGLPTAGIVFTWAITLGVPASIAVPALMLPPRWHRRYRWRVDERGLEIRRGIWWRSRIFVPRNRLQHTDVAQGPIERQLGLARLVVHTAGTHNASTTLHGISFETALAARRSLAHDRDDDEDGDADGT